MRGNGKGLRQLVDAIVTNDEALVGGLIAGAPELAAASFPQGATRAEASANFLAEVGQYIYAGDTALHFAAAAYRVAMAERLIEAGAPVRARNRRGTEPLHAAATGSPGSAWWNPPAQAAMIERLIAAGADANARNLDGATALHRAVRTRCAEAVRALLRQGADPLVRTRNGSTARELALHTTGRSGSGSAEAKAQQEEILRLLA